MRPIWARRFLSVLLSATFLGGVAKTVHAGFASTEVFLPAVGRSPGANGAQIYTTVWATNLTQAPESFTFHFLKQGQSNAAASSPITRSRSSSDIALASTSFTDTLAPGETKIYENIVEAKLGLTGVIGAARIVSSGEIFVAERIFNQNPGDDLGKTEGMFFTGVPKDFSISPGQSASVQAVNQGGTENFRTNFVLVESGGGSPTVNVQVFDASGHLQGQKAYPLKPYEQILPNIADVVPGIATTNSRITATVTGGTGSAILALAQIANESQDSSGAEMTFRDSLLGGGPAGVTSLNGLTGALTIAHGANTTVNVNGSTITIDAVSGSGTGLTAVAHDDSLTGSGTVSLPLGVANGQVVRSLIAGATTLHDNVTLAAGSNVTITPSGNTFTIAATGGGGSTSVATDPTLHGNGTGPSPLGVALPANWSAGGSYVLSVTNTFGGTAPAILGTGTDGFGVVGVGTDTGTGVVGVAAGLDYKDVSASFTGVLGRGTTGVIGAAIGGNTGRVGTPNAGIEGTGSNGSNGVLGVSGGGNSAGVEGEFSDGGNFGALGGSGYGVYYQGGLAGTGTKNFIEPHPTDPTNEIRYVSLEGRESGTYFRGIAQILNGLATIDVPEDFRMVTSDEGLTVIATPIGAPAVIWIAHQGLDRIVLRSSADVQVSYMVNGIRKAFPDWEPVSANRDFVPRSADGRRLVAGLPPENLQRLKTNGTLNPDGTINLETAHRLGWDQSPGWNDVGTETKR